MATPFDTIADMALIVIQDYRLNHLYEIDEDAFRMQMAGMIVKSVPKFVSCNNSLSYKIETQSFESDLTYKEIDILADLVVITWFESVVNDITQVNLHLQGRDAKHNAESSNLKEKSERLDRLREKVRQDMCDYEISNM